MAEYPIVTAPLDRVIEVRLLEEQEWVRVQWDGTSSWFKLVDEDMWVLPIELDAWREVPLPSTEFAS